jgi:hypothetical protein
MWKSDGFEVGWGGWQQSVNRDPPFEQKEDDKRAYGIELAKIDHEKEEERVGAAKKVFGDNQNNIVLWVAAHWHLEPIVIAAREGYIPPTKPLLDKEALAAKLLDCADEKVVGRDGQKQYAVDAKDRLGFYNLYSKIMGFIDKPEAQTAPTFASNDMRIILVEPDKQESVKVIAPVKQVEDEILNVTPIRIKAV